MSPLAFHDDPTQTPWTTILLSVGGGCLLFFALAGALMIWGSCSSFGACLNAAERDQVERVAPIQAFLDATGRGDFTAARAMTTPDLQRRVEADGFEPFVRASGDLFIGGQARYMAQHLASDPPRTLLVVQLYDDTQTLRGVATFTLRKVSDPTGPDPLRIDDLRPGIPDDLRAPDVRASVEALLHAHVAHLARGDLDAAWRHFADADTQDPAGFRLFIQTQGDLFHDAEAALIDLQHDADHATARLAIRDPTTHATRAELLYDLRREGASWVILSVRTSEADPR